VNDDYASTSVNDLKKMKTFIDRLGSDLTVEDFEYIHIRDGNCHVEFDAADRNGYFTFNLIFSPETTGPRV